jgi:DNA-binding GntR family transcriptional regulator
MRIEPVRQLPLPETIQRQIKAAIVAGQFVPGQMLRQEELAQRLGASRAPLREALSRLEAEGLVVLLPRRGYAVMSLDRDEIAELFDLRIVLEERLARLAAERRSAADIARLKGISAQMAALSPQTNPDIVADWYDQNTEFHSALVEPAGLRHFTRLYNTVRENLEPYIRVEMQLTGGFEQAQDEHDQIIAAFVGRDADTLGCLVCEHARHTKERLLAGLDRQAQDVAS